MSTNSKSPEQNSETPVDVVECAKLLKARLQYARYKVEHNLVQNTFSEIEAALAFPNARLRGQQPTDSSETHEAASTLAAIRKRCELPPTPRSPHRNTNIPLKRRSSSSLDDFDSEEAAQTILMLSSGAGTPKLSHARSPANGILSPHMRPSSPTFPYSGFKKSTLELQPSKLSDLEPAHPKEWPYRERSSERGSLSPRFITIPSRHIESDPQDNPFLVQPRSATQKATDIPAQNMKASNWPKRAYGHSAKSSQGALTDSFRVTKPLNNMRIKKP
ncbi:hypothetical protein VKS41_007992 [Umbelopsis sp. WA50703]